MTRVRIVYSAHTSDSISERAAGVRSSPVIFSAVAQSDGELDDITIYREVAVAEQAGTPYSP